MFVYFLNLFGFILMCIPGLVIAYLSYITFGWEPTFKGLLFLVVSGVLISLGDYLRNLKGN